MTTTAAKSGTKVTAYVDGVPVAARTSKKDTPWASVYSSTGDDAASAYGLSLHGTREQADKAVAKALGAGWWASAEVVQVEGLS